MDVIVSKVGNSLLADTENFLTSALAMGYRDLEGNGERSESNQLAFIQ